MRRCAALVVVFLALEPAWAVAEVRDASANGFTVTVALTIHATPTEVYHRLVYNVGKWWNPEHTYSHNAHNLIIEEKAMGCFCEKLPHGMVRHMEVVYFDPGKSLGLTGALGPLQLIAAGGNRRVDLTPAPEGTKLDVTYAVFGYLPKGMTTWAAPVDSVLTEQFTRLKAYLEGGRRH